MVLCQMQAISTVGCHTALHSTKASCAKMFSDDTNISIPGRTLADLQPLINSELVNHNNCWLRVNKFSLNVAQTEFMIVASRQRLLAESNTEICVELGNYRIERVVHTKSFSLTIDGRLSWINYINEVCKKSIRCDRCSKAYQALCLSINSYTNL